MKVAVAALLALLLAVSVPGAAEGSEFAKSKKTQFTTYFTTSACAGDLGSFAYVVDNESNELQFIACYLVDRKTEVIRLRAKNLDVEIKFNEIELNIEKLTNIKNQT